MTCSLMLSVAAGLLVLIVGVVSPFHQLAVLAPLLPALLLEDLFRYLFFRRMRPGLAVACDAVWVFVSCIGFVRLQSSPSITLAVTIWGLGGLAAAGTGLLLARVGFAPIGESFGWWKQQLWPSSRWLTLESVFFHADQELTAFGFTAVAGATVFGQWQIAQSLLGLAVFVNAGLSIVSVTHLSHNRSDRRTAVVASLLSAGFVVVVTATLYAGSSPLLHLLYGHNRVKLPSSTIVGTGLVLAMAAAATGPVALLRARRDERTLPLARGVALLVFSPAAVVVAAHSFAAALFVLAGGGLTYLLIVARAAFGTSGVVVPLPHTPEVACELSA